MKIQIASLAALERLIGGDATIEIEIRQSVAENFAKKHLKSISHNELTSACNRDALKMLGEEFFQKKQFSGSYTLKSEYLEGLKNAIDCQLRDKISQLVSESIAAFGSKESIDRLIYSASDRIANELTDGNIMKRINAAADAKIKERLGL